MKKSITLHPVLFAVLPALFLYARNRSEVRPADLAWPLLIAIPASLLVWWLCSQVLRDRTRGAVLASLFWLWFSSFDHVRRALDSLGALGLWLQILNFLAWPLLAVLVIRWRRGAQPLSSGLNAMAIALVAWQLIVVSGFEFGRARLPAAQAAHPVRLVAGRTDGMRPHIYFLVLDAYAREDMLREVYHYDNRDFLAYLRSKGFRVVPRARANYCQTLTSLASCLNLDYLSHLRPAAASAEFARADGSPGNRMEPGDASALPDLINHNRVGDFLRGQGYHITAFSSGAHDTELTSADSLLSYARHLDEFQLALLASTPLGWIARQGDSRWADADRVHVETVRYAFAHLAEPARSRDPVFVYAHILSPHPPFILDEAGNRRAYARDRSLANADYYAATRDAYITGYREKLKFTNHMLRTTLDQILAEAERPTAIILVSDHGSRVPERQRGPETTDVRERLANLIAVRLPGEQDPRPPDDMSMVNVFRLVLNRYFGTDLPLLPDKSYVCGREFSADGKAGVGSVRAGGPLAETRGR